MRGEKIDHRQTSTFGYYSNKINIPSSESRQVGSNDISKLDVGLKNEFNTGKTDLMVGDQG